MASFQRHKRRFAPAADYITFNWENWRTNETWLYSNRSNRNQETEHEP